MDFKRGSDNLARIVDLAADEKFYAHFVDEDFGVSALNQQVIVIGAIGEAEFILKAAFLI